MSKQQEIDLKNEITLLELEHRKLELKAEIKRMQEYLSPGGEMQKPGDVVGKSVPCPPIQQINDRVIYVDVQDLHGEEVPVFMEIARDAVSNGYLIPRISDDRAFANLKHEYESAAEHKKIAEDNFLTKRLIYLQGLWSRQDTRNSENLFRSKE